MTAVPKCGMKINEKPASDTAVHEPLYRDVLDYRQIPFGVASRPCAPRR